MDRPSRRGTHWNAAPSRLGHCPDDRFLSGASFADPDHDPLNGVDTAAKSRGSASEGIGEFLAVPVTGAEIVAAVKHMLAKKAA